MGGGGATSLLADGMLCMRVFDAAAALPVLHARRLMHTVLRHAAHSDCAAAVLTNPLGLEQANPGAVPVLATSHHILPAMHSVVGLCVLAALCCVCTHAHVQVPPALEALKRLSMLDKVQEHFAAGVEGIAAARPSFLLAAHGSDDTIAAVRDDVVHGVEGGWQARRLDEEPALAPPPARDDACGGVGVQADAVTEPEFYCNGMQVRCAGRRPALALTACRAGHAGRVSGRQCRRRAAGLQRQCLRQCHGHPSQRDLRGPLRQPAVVRVPLGLPWRRMPDPPPHCLRGDAADQHAAE